MKRLLLTLLVLGSLAGCDFMPGKPVLEKGMEPGAEVTNFNHLYTQNCAGCHGANGTLGAARPLNDPLYLALISPEDLRSHITTGVPGTTAPAFARQAGGKLTDRQIEMLVEGIRSRWGDAEKFKNVALPPYSLRDAVDKGSRSGEPGRGAVAYRTYCAQCHGAEGTGGPKGGSVADPAYLALVSDQSLRSSVIAGRTDLGMPDWRGYIPGKPMGDQEISDVVAWLSAKRRTEVP
ncbi:MAG: c-type cytochrome [Deltaproteobacteria bacterium]|nr:c-type cytochrome [Deltaproteobacteria bacterium]